MLKRGLSGIVTTVIIILLVLAAVAILWAAVRPALESSASSVGTTEQFALSFSIVGATQDEDNLNAVSVSVRRNAGGSDGLVQGVNVVLKDNSGNSCVKRVDEAFGVLETKTVPVNLQNECQTGFSTSLSSVEVAPIINDGSENGQIGAVLDSSNIGSGSTGGTGGATCSDSQQNQGESDVDCGGPNCVACADGQSCFDNGDCSSGNCVSGTCQAVSGGTCGDGNVDAGEQCDDGAANDDLAACTSTCTINSNLLLHLKFDGDATDSSANGYDGTEQGSVTYVLGQIGQAAHFNKANTGDQVQVSSSVAVPLGNSERTFSAWIRFDSNDSNLAIFSYGGSQAGQEYTPSLANLGGNFRVAISRGTGWIVFAGGDVSSIVSGLQDQWFHLALTSNQTGMHNCYINGLYCGQGILELNTQISNVYVGRRYSGGGSLWFDGTIDDLRVYDRILSTGEINSLYDLGSP